MSIYTLTVIAGGVLYVAHCSSAGMYVNMRLGRVIIGEAVEPGPDYSRVPSLFLFILLNICGLEFIVP